ncbi:MAG: hypothetical protein FJ267_01770 [Planctomycetes bacterium]|nr:hypothetical protein [Planctomycetota bacterium]
MRHLLVVIAMVAVVFLNGRVFTKSATADDSAKSDSTTKAGEKAEGKSATKKTKIEGISLDVPESWKSQPPSNKLRLAQFLIPPAEGDKFPTELVVSSFPGGGGGIDPNLKRWIGQFSPEGRKMKITTGKCPQGKYYFSDIKGTYEFTAGGPFAGGKKEMRPEHRSLSVVVVTSDNDVYFLRLTGTEKAVTAAEKDFRNSFGADASQEEDYAI